MTTRGQDIPGYPARCVLLYRMTTNETRALIMVCLVVLGILVGIVIGRAQVAEEIAHLESAAVSVQGVAACIGVL